MSTEGTRYYLNGIFLHVPGGSESQFAAATDGNRLARFHCDVADGAEGMPDIILPRKAVAALAQLLDEEGGTVGIAVSTTKFRRSEEHTSELQSLMRISYAVFCLKKKNPITQKKHTTETRPP